MKKQERLIAKVEEFIQDKEKELDVEEFLYTIEPSSKKVVELRVDGLLYDIFNNMEEYIHNFAQDFLKEFEILLENEADWDFVQSSVIELHIK